MKYKNNEPTNDRSIAKMQDKKIKKKIKKNKEK